jgi:hypothetical protein
MHPRIQTKTLALAAALTAALTATLPAHAALSFFTSSASFLAAVGSTGTDTFEVASAGGAHASPFNRTAGVYSYRATAAGGFFGSGAGADAALSTDSSGTAIGLASFAASIGAIGANIYATDVNGVFYSGSLQVVATDFLGATLTQTLSPTAIGTGSFLGFVSTSTIVSLTVTPVLGDRFASIDNLVLGQAVSPVPEPSGVLVMVAGLLVLGCAARGRGAASKA